MSPVSQMAMAARIALTAVVRMRPVLSTMMCSTLVTTPNTHSVTHSGPWKGEYQL